MELLDMVPADAIALRLYSLPAAAAAAASLYYAWLVAALAAAVGLWRIRAVGAGVRRASAAVVGEKPQAPQAGQPSPAVEEPLPAARAPEPADDAASRSEPSTPSKVRFTAYYGVSGGDDGGVVDGVWKCSDEDEDDDNGVDGEVEAVLRRTASAPERRRAATALAAAPWEEREMAVRRRGDLGWYRHLDMAALDGSVVRVWDGQLTASPRARRRRAGLEFRLSF
ncbi:hypothetical protein GQ55_2G266800 [Panicum hallii var. hallii]|uniref:Uncharacterized protein n=1 Tax=Panicum hallii var. hallii TaxID=1504633 RepID=A0A2T7ESL8_9POAL|nr:hypothetical protein GQ55_2G266800 [Panicum hallii var. hallii]